MRNSVIHISHGCKETPMSHIARSERTSRLPACIFYGPLLGPWAPVRPAGCNPCFSVALHAASSCHFGWMLYDAITSLILTSPLLRQRRRCSCFGGISRSIKRTRKDSCVDIVSVRTSWYKAKQIRILTLRGIVRAV